MSSSADEISAALGPLRHQYGIPEERVGEWQTFEDRILELLRQNSIEEYRALREAFFEILIHLDIDILDELQDFHDEEYQLRLEKGMPSLYVDQFPNTFNETMLDLLRGYLQQLPRDIPIVSQLLQDIFTLDDMGWSGASLLLEALKEIPQDDLSVQAQAVMQHLFANDIPLDTWYYIAHNEPWERFRDNRFHDDWFENIRNILFDYQVTTENDANRTSPTTEREIILVDYDTYTNPLQNAQITPNSVYHGFFTVFCTESGRLQNRAQLDIFRRIFLDASNILDLQESDIATLRMGSQRQLCRWMQKKQNERCQVCTTGAQYDVEPFSQEPVNEIPLLFLWIHQNRHCFDIIPLYHYLQLRPMLDGSYRSMAGQISNPLNRIPFTIEELTSIGQRFHSIYEIMQSVYQMIQ